MDTTYDYQKLVDIHKKFITFIHYWDTHKHGNLYQPDSPYSLYRSELIDAILLLDKDRSSKAYKALNRDN